jgi:serine/threonine protein kinase
LQNLHEIGYTHGDIKLENICIEHDRSKGDDITARLIDFGMAIDYKHNQNRLKVFPLRNPSFNGNYLFASFS